MPNYCAVSQCLSNNRGFSSQTVPTHHFPTLESVRHQWILACGKGTDFVPTSHTTICQKHFTKTDYITHNLNGKKIKKRLKSQAVPTMFLPLRPTESHVFHDYGSLHRPIVPKALPDHVACEFCEAELEDTESAILEHLKDQHVSIVDTLGRICKLCKYQAKDNEDMFEHFMFPRKREKSACHICEKKFQEVPYGHYRAKHEDYIKIHWLQCDQCKLYLTHRSKNSHMRLYHVQKDPVVLFEPTKIEYKVGGDPSQPSVSNVTSLVYSNNFELPKLRTKRNNVYKNVDERPCQFCNEPVINSKVYIIEHLKKCHDFQDNNCHLCQSSFDDSGALLKHLMFQLEEGSKCFLCDVPYFINRSKLYHIRLHHQDYMKNHWFHCNFCSSYVMKKLEDSHVLRCKREVDRVNYLKSISNDIEGGFCKYCEVPISSISIPRLFYTHMQEVHFQQIKDTWFKCRRTFGSFGTCYKVFPSEMVRNDHERMVHTVSASVDQKKMLLDEQFKNMHQPKTRKIKCSFCDLVFTSRKQVNLHIGKSHKSIIKHVWYPCSTCDLYLPTRPKRDEHELVEHQVIRGAQPLNPEFIDVNSIKREELIMPSPPKKYMEWTLRRGAKKANVDHVLKMHKCDYCEALYRYRKDLEQHINFTHELINSRDRESNIVKQESIMPQAKNAKAVKLSMIKCDFCDMYKFSKDLYSHVNQSHMSTIKDFWFNCSICDLYLPTKQQRDNHELVQHQVISKAQPIKPEFIQVKSNPNVDEQEMMNPLTKKESIEVKEETIETVDDPVELVEVKEELVERVDEPMEEILEDPLQILG